MTAFGAAQANGSSDRRGDRPRSPVVPHLGPIGPIASRAVAQCSGATAAARQGSRATRCAAGVAWIEAEADGGAGLAASAAGWVETGVVTGAAIVAGSEGGVKIGTCLPLATEPQPALLGQHLAGVAAVVVEVGGADVEAQAGLESAGAADAFLEHLHADAQVGHRIEGREVAAEGLVLVVVHMRHHLHQPLRADGALRERVEARLDGHDGEDQGRVEPDPLADVPGFLAPAG